MKNMNKILVLDNYDSFTYNLVHYIEDITKQSIDVFRNDKIELSRIQEYDAIILSPGPGLPKDAGIMPELIKTYGSRKKILGICLGHQALIEAYGGSLINLEKVYHGVATNVEIDSSQAVFSNLPNSIEVGRYHSWAVNKNDFPSCFDVIAKDSNGIIMAAKHKTHNLVGLQFHPESILTPNGYQILKNWINN